MNDDEVWAVIDLQRGRTADLLEQLSDEEWRQPSLCEGWAVRDVAAHLTLQQIGLGTGMVLAITRARLRPTRAIAFYRAIAPVAREVGRAPGLLARFGIGEAPIGWQGTVSLWRDAADLTRFAYRQPEHRAVIARTPTDRWYAEELFARFAVRDLTGDRPVLGWLEEGQT